MKRERRFGCSILHFLLLLPFKKLYQINLKVWIHPVWFPNPWVVNEMWGVPITFRGVRTAASLLPRSGLSDLPRGAVQTLLFSMDSTVWKMTGVTTIYNQPQPVKETHWNDFISNISNRVHWHFTGQVEIFHLVSLLAYLERYILIYIFDPPSGETNQVKLFHRAEDLRTKSSFF